MLREIFFHLLLVLVICHGHPIDEGTPTLNTTSPGTGPEHFKHGLHNIASGAKDTAVGAAETVGNAYSAFKKGIADRVEAVEEAIGEKASAAKDAAVGVVTGAGEAISDAAGNVKQGVVNVATGARDKVVAAGEAVVTTATDVKDGVVGAGRAVGNAAKNVAKGTGNVIGGGLESAGKALQSPEHPEAELAKAIDEKTGEFRNKTAEFRKNAEAHAKTDN